MMKNSIGEQTKLHYNFDKILGYKEVSQVLPSLRKFNQSEVAKERQRILNYNDHYGGLATLDTFGVDRKLIYIWRQRLRQNKKKTSALVPELTISKTNYRIYFNSNCRYKTKIKRLRIKKAESIIGRIQIDTIERIDHGIKEYFYCAIDTKTKFALTLNYKTKTSRNTVDFWQKFKSVQTDNGLEFLGDFDQYLTKDNLPHFFTYPRCPRINGCVEHYNRIIQKEFIDQNLDSLLVDKIDFNHKLADYLIWYPSRRVHKSLDLKSPLQKLVERWSMSNMSVTYT